MLSQKNIFNSSIIATFIAFLFPFCAHAASQPLDNNAQDHLISGLLHKYHLAPAEQLFSYTFKHEMYSPLLGSSRKLPAEIEKIALQQNSYLQSTTYYRDLRILRDGKKVRSYQLSPSKDKNKNESGKLLYAKTSDGRTVEGTLLLRGSDTLLVVGGGFTHYREKMAMMGDLFNQYDVLFFDYRGHGFEQFKLFNPHTWRIVGINPREARLGLSEEKDVFAIVSEARKQKQYTNVVGLGVCYSGLIFIKTAAMHQNLFTKLVLDGCWFSLRDAAEILAQDPGLLARPQSPTALRHNILVKQRWFQKALMWIAQKTFNIEFNTVSALDYAPLLKDSMPVLFIHGKDDVLIPRQQFEILFHATNCRQKVAFITSNEHVRNYLKEKELYKEVVETFINTSYEQFNHFMMMPEAFIEYKKAHLHKLTT